MQKLKYVIVNYVLLILVLLVSVNGHATIWKKIDRNGITHFTNKPTGNGWKLVIPSPSTKNFYGKRSYNSAAGREWKKRFTANLRFYRPLVDKLSAQLKVDPALVHAVVLAESAYNPRAVSKKGAMGLMQLMPQTAARYGVDNPYNPSQNLRAGITHLKILLDKYRNMNLALAAYNAGSGAVEKYGNAIPPYPETRQYVKKVLATFHQEKQANKQI